MEAVDDGGNAGGPPLTRSEMHTLARAGRFPMSTEDREKAVRLVLETMEKTKSYRTKLTAAKTLAALDALNMEQEKRDAGGEQLNVNLSGEVHIDRSKVIQAGKEVEEMLRSRMAPTPPESNGHVHRNGSNGTGNGHH